MLLVGVLRRPNTFHSQGTAVMMNAIKGLDQGARNRVLGTVLFGYTKNGQTKGSIAGYPQDRLLVICRADDGVCGGALLVTIGHFGYLADGSGTKATNFLAEKINAGGSSTSPKAAPKAAKGKVGKGGKGAYVDVEGTEMDS